MRKISLLLFLTFTTIPACVGGPFNRGLRDNRPEERVKIAEIRPDASIVLEDGLVLRPFGITSQAATEDERVQDLLESCQGVEASWTWRAEAPRESAWIVVWREAQIICGLGLRSWDPWAKPWDLHDRVDLNLNIAILAPAAIDEAALKRADGPQALIESLRGLARPVAGPDTLSN